MAGIPTSPTINGLFLNNNNNIEKGPVDQLKWCGDYPSRALPPKRLSWFPPSPHPPTSTPNPRAPPTPYAPAPALGLGVGVGGWGNQFSSSNGKRAPTPYRPKVDPKSTKIDFVVNST